jgi:hypothetical protein
MIDSERIYKILQETTQVYRKGDLVEQKNIGNVNVTEIFGYPHSSKSLKDGNYEKVDMIFVDIVVDKDKARKRKDELVSILSEYPEPERLAGGPSYIELAPNLGLEQEGALRTMALGKVLGLWEIVSGKTFILSNEVTRELAGNGLLMITGYNLEGRI